MKGILVLSLILCVVLMYAGLDDWQQAQDLEYKNALSGKDIARAQNDLKYLASLPAGRPPDLESTYRDLEYQIRLFSQYHDLKISLEVVSKSGLGQAPTVPSGQVLSQIGTPSVWPGIRQIPLIIHFDDLKSMDQYIEVFDFLKNIEESVPLHVLSMMQKGGHLETNIQIFGRGI